MHPRQTSMGRRGWQAIEVPQGWFNVIRGPRPPSVRWPQAQSSHRPVKVVRNASVTPAQVSVGRPRVQHDPVRKSGPVPTPEEVIQRARRRATQLESAMQLLDAGDPALVPLQEALKRAKAQASAPPLVDRVSASEMYVARKKKRLEEAEQEILEAIKRRDVLKAEVVAGEERLAGLKAEVAREASGPLQVPTEVGGCDEIAHLKARLVAVEEERDVALRSKLSKRQAAMPRTSGVRTRTHHIRPMPSLVPAELSQWLLESTIRFPGNPRVGWPGRSGVAAHIHVVRRSSASDGVERRNGSVTMRSGNLCGDKQCELRPTYGLRGVRVGEASHPGPSPDLKRQAVAEHSGGQ